VNGGTTPVRLTTNSRPRHGLVRPDRSSADRDIGRARIHHHIALTCIRVLAPIETDGRVTNGAAGTTTRALGSGSGNPPPWKVFGSGEIVKDTRSLTPVQGGGPGDTAEPAAPKGVSSPGQVHPGEVPGAFAYVTESLEVCGPESTHAAVFVE